MIPIRIFSDSGRNSRTACGRRSWRAPLTAIAGFTIALTGSGCGGGDGALEGDLGVLLAPYQILDLATNSVQSTDVAPDLTRPAYRDRYVVFHRVDGSTAALGSRTGIGGQADEPVTAVALNTYYLAVFELTRAQWQRIAGTTPWATLDPVGLALAGSATDAAAVGVSRNAVTSAFSGTHLALPSAQQWEKAARAGTTTAFPWGDSPDESLAQTFARVAETRGSTNGPVAPGGRSANAFGFYDMAGNVWELTSGTTISANTAEIRGGSWQDTVLQARPANRNAIDPATAHALVGVRPVLVP